MTTMIDICIGQRQQGLPECTVGFKLLAEMCRVLSIKKRKQNNKKIGTLGTDLAENWDKTMGLIKSTTRWDTRLKTGTVWDTLGRLVTLY